MNSHLIQLQEDVNVEGMPPEEWPNAKLSLKEILEIKSRRVHQNWYQDINEGDNTLNSLSRALIVAMKREKGQCWLYKINLYGGEHGDMYSICKPFYGQVVYNFEYSVVAPVVDEKVISLIRERDIAEYTGTKEDAKRLDKIFERFQSIGGEQLSWS